MNLGKWRERLAIVRRTRVQRADGGYDVAAVTIATRWASVTPVSARENEQAGRLRGSVTYLIHMHALDSDLTHDDTLIWVTRQNLEMNVREVRVSSIRAKALEVVAESGAVVSG